jgi:hypothetical protein
MAFAITYPSDGGKGASSNNRLVTACGTFDEFPEGGTYKIYGKVYPAASPPTAGSPPTGASLGTCVVGGAVSTWHFNGAPPLDGCTVGSDYILRVWLTSTAVTYYLHRDAAFTACDAADASCSVNCPDAGGGMQLMQMRAAGPVISESAARYFDVVPAAEVSAVLQFFGAQANDLSKLKVRLGYDEVRSSFDRAVWSAESGPGEQLRLEVTTGTCCARATLARLHVGEDVVQVLERWTADYFDLLDGGTLAGGEASGGQRTGSIRVIPVERKEPQRAPRAAKKSVTKALPKSTPLSKTAKRRKGRGR